MNVGNKISGITLTVGKNYFSIRMIYQKTNKFASCISRSSKNSNFNHN